MLRCLQTPVAFAGSFAGPMTGLALASCLMMSGCVIVVESDSEVDCLTDHHGDGTPRLGIGVGRVDAALAGQLNINADRATLVTSVNPGSPADRAGVRQFDVITKVDGSDDASLGAIQSALRGKQSGETVTLTVIRNAQPIDLPVTIEADSDHNEEH